MHKPLGACDHYNQLGTGKQRWPELEPAEEICRGCMQVFCAIILQKWFAHAHLLTSYACTKRLFESKFFDCAATTVECIPTDHEEGIILQWDFDYFPIVCRRNDILNANPRERLYEDVFFTVHPKASVEASLRQMPGAYFIKNTALQFTFCNYRL